MKYSSLLIFLLVLVACKKSEPISIKDDVIFLSDDKLEGRQTGTVGEKKAANYIANRFKNLGIEAKGTQNYLQPFTFKPKTNPHQKVNYNVTESDSTITGLNVIGFLDNNAENTVVIGAHYDHLGYGAEGSLHRGEKAIHNGAR